MRGLRKEQSMKKVLSLCLAVLLCAALCGCQRKISLPAVKEIGSIQVETTDGREITLTQESEKAQLMDLLSTGVSTGRQSCAGSAPGHSLRHNPSGKSGRRHHAVLLPREGRHADRAALYRHFPAGGGLWSRCFPRKNNRAPPGSGPVPDW